MTSKVPTAEEVLALVTAASTSEPTMQQLLMQVQQAQHAQLLATAAELNHQQQQQQQQQHEHQTDGGGGNASLAAGVADLKEQLAMAHAMGIDGTTAIPTSGGGGDPAAAMAAAAAAAASASANSSAIRRKSIPLSMKKEAIEWILGPGKGVPSRAEKHFSAKNWDVSASSFRKWWKNRDKIMNDSSTKKRISGGGRKPYLQDGEERLLVIVIQDRAKKDRVTRKWIAKMAQHMFQRSNANFKASENWVTKFIRRNGLTLKRSYVTYDNNGAAAGAGGPEGSAQAAVVGGAHAPGSVIIYDDGDVEDDDDEDMAGVPQPGPDNAYVAACRALV